MPHIFVKLVSRLLLFVNVLPKEDIREIRVIRVQKKLKKLQLLNDFSVCFMALEPENIGFISRIFKKCLNLWAK